MQRRTFVRAFGGMSSASLAGCSDVEVDPSTQELSTSEPGPVPGPVLLLYGGGVGFAEAANGAADRAYADKAFREEPDVIACSYHGRASGYFDSAAWCFASAAELLDGESPEGVELCEDAKARAFHLGMTHMYRARDRIVRSKLEVPVEGDGRAPPASTTEGETYTLPDPDGMNPAQPTDSDVISGTSNAELAEAHSDRASQHSIASSDELRSVLPTDDG